MMKQITLTLALCLFLTGCSDKVARQYAEELTRLMDEYSKRVDHLISGETKRYREEAQALETARTEEVGAGRVPPGRAPRRQAASQRLPVTVTP